MPTSSNSAAPRRHICASGKFLELDGRPFLIRGVAYGTFAPRGDGECFPERDQIDRDFRAMARAGLNTVRTYCAPPLELLDLAGEHGLHVMAGLAWTQHVAFLDDRQLRRDIRLEIVARARTIARHPAVVLTTLGNEIPPAVVRWHGQRRIERFLQQLFDDVRQSAPEMLLTYVNYPPTEFLDLSFVDVYAFNVYLHDEAAMRRYVRRLQHRAGNRPLLLAECGADSQRHGAAVQADMVAAQTRAAFAEGACGAVVFGWTDEWWRGGFAIEDWSFGLVDRNREPKPVCAAVKKVFDTAPFGDRPAASWPSVTVVVCAYNAAATIDDCLSALERVDYPRFDMLVVDDGSTDTTADEVRKHPRVGLLQIAQSGLSVARNAGARAASGEIVAYVDADVRVEANWLTYLVQPFMTSDAVAAGGPNVVPEDDGWFAQCVARAPGAPTHVLFDDCQAEHVPGCNLAIRRSALLEAGGFDPVFVRAGDDVDVCWRLQDRGGRVLFAPSALVWHHHRSRLAQYWRQQVGYGEGEAWLRERHPGRFLGANVAWQGRIYSSLPFVRSLTAMRLHSGVWGTASFPSIYHIARHPLQAMPHATPWVLTSAALLLAGLLTSVIAGVSVASLVAALAGGIGLTTTAGKAFACARRSDLTRTPLISGCGPGSNRMLYRTTIAALHIVQPLARTWGRLRGLRHPVGRREVVKADVPVVQPSPSLRPAVSLPRPLPRECRFWSNTWINSDALLTRTVDRLRTLRLGREIHIDDGWCQTRDVSVSLGIWAWAHLQALVEDHGAGRCLLRARVQLRPRMGGVALVTVAVLATLMAFVESSLTTASATAVLMVSGLSIVAGATSRGAQNVLDVVADVAAREGMQRIDGHSTPPAEAGGGNRPLSSRVGAWLTQNR